MPFKQEHTFLGMRLDGPVLTWKAHIDYLRTSCLKRLNIMKSIASTRWGTDRDTLLRLYTSFVRSKVEYGSPVYGSAAASLTKRLDTIQTTALRIATGAFCSSPVMALQAESGIPPLCWRRTFLECRLLHRISSLPHSSTTLRLLRSAGVSAQHPTWPVKGRQPFLVRALNSHHLLEVPAPDPSPIPTLSPAPPWVDFVDHTALTLHPSYLKSTTSVMAKTLFLELDRSTYHDHFRIFTDGSHVPPATTTAAVYVEDLDLCQTWRIRGMHQALTAELFAIKQALTFVRSQLRPQKVVVYTDSQSSLFLIRSASPESHRLLVFEIQGILLGLGSPDWTVRLQWVPSHVGILGNEIADTAASKVPHTAPPVSLASDAAIASSAVLAACSAQWTVELRRLLPNSAIGQHRVDALPHPWARGSSRTLDVALTRLRIGHCRLEAHLYRLHLTPTPYCQWCLTEAETIEHFLLVCPRHFSHRTVLRAGVAALGAAFSIPVILGGKGLDDQGRRKIRRLTESFLRGSGQLARI